MKITLFLFLLLLGSCKGFEPLQNTISDGNEDFGSDVSTVTPEMGGSNYAFIELGKYATDPTNENWVSDVKVPVVHYHLYPQKVRSDLQSLIQNGQKKIALPIWFNQPNLNCETSAHTVCPQANGKMPLIAKQNLQNILKDIAALPFKEVQIRLAHQGAADVYGWTQFEESIYESNKGFIFDVIDVSEEILNSPLTNPKGVKVIYDLGLELMGSNTVKRNPWHREYLKRIWAEYLAKYPLEKTIGFSFNHAHRDGTLESLKIFDDSGKRPLRLAVDIYVDRSTHFQNLKWALELRGWGKDYPIYIQETYRNNVQVAQDILSANIDLGLNIRTIMQWPLDPGFSGSSNATDYSFDNYK